MPLVSNVVDHMSRFPPYTTNKGVGAIIPEELAGHLVHDNNTTSKREFRGSLSVGEWVTGFDQRAFKHLTVMEHLFVCCICLCLFVLWSKRGNRGYKMASFRPS